MGSKQSKITVADAKVSTVFGSCGFGACSSTCCEDQATADPRLQYIERMVRAEIATLEHLVLKKMIAHFEKGVVPQLEIKEDSQSLTLDMEKVIPVEEMKLPERFKPPVPSVGS